MDILGYAMIWIYWDIQLYGHTGIINDMDILGIFNDMDILGYSIIWTYWDIQ
jgi:hypothetical protein